MLLQTLTILVDFATSKASPGTPPLPPTPPGKILFSYFRLIFPYFFHFFCRSKIHQKSDLYQTLPKPQKSDPCVPKARFWSHFGCLLASLLHSFSYLFSKCENSVFEQQYNTLASFRPPETSPFRIDFGSKKHVFPRHPPESCFSSFYIDLC